MFAATFSRSAGMQDNMGQRAKPHKFYKYYLIVMYSLCGLFSCVIIGISIYAIYMKITKAKQ